MKKHLLILFSIIIISLINDVELYAYQNEKTTILFVRHAERAEDGTRNPPISDKGQLRAINLSKVVADYPIKAIYSTAYKRTEMTAKPTADSLKLQVLEYGFDDIDKFLSQIINENIGNAVLIVGHSNTTPNLVNKVIGEDKYEQLEETEYGDLFIVRAFKLGNGTVELRKF